jgi:hypothetical protein
MNRFEFRRDEDTGRTAGGPEHQPYSGNPYGRFPGQDRAQRDRYPSDRYSSDSGQNYGQREPYNTIRAKS